MWGKSVLATRVLNNLFCNLTAFLKLTRHPLFSAFGLFTPTVERGRSALELRPRSRLPASGQTRYFPNHKSIRNFSQTLPTQTRRYREFEQTIDPAG